MILKDRRLGKFIIPLEVINNNQDLVLAILSKVIVVKADVTIYTDEIEYQAISEHFSPIDVKSIIPTYNIIVTNEEGIIHINFRKELNYE